MRSVIVKMSKHKEGFTSMGDFNGEKGNYVGALLGHYDFMELYQCDRMSEFFFEKTEESEQHVLDENNGELQLRHEYESQKLLLFSLDSQNSSKVWNDPQTSAFPRRQGLLSLFRQMRSTWPKAMTC